MPAASGVLGVTGANGHLGRQVVELLSQGGAHVVAVTRDPGKLQGRPGVAVRRGDFDDPATLAQAFGGIDRLLLVSTDVLGQGRRRAEQHLRAVEAARKADVGHIVYTSIVGADEPSKVAATPDHNATEEAIRAAGMGFTFLRNGLYMENLLGILPRAVASGKHVSAAGDGATAYVARADCGRAAAGALLGAGTGNRTLEVTGPEALTQGAILDIASAITGRSIAYLPVPPQAILDSLLDAGLPEELSRALVSFDEGIAAGEFRDPSDGVRRLTGRDPVTVEAFLAQHRAALVSQ